jgi:hypothetical protein
VRLELLTRPDSVENRLTDLEAADGLRLLGSPVPELFEAEDRKPRLVVETAPEVVLEALDLRWDAGREERDVELPAVQPQHEVVAPVVRLVVVLVADAVCPGEERPHELPGQRPVEVGGIHAHVEVAPDHQPGDIAPDQEDAAGRGKPPLNLVGDEKRLPLRVERLLARE